RLLRDDATALASSAQDEQGYASGALVWHFELAPHATREVDIAAPMSGALPPLPSSDDAERWIAHESDRVAADWHSRLDRVGLTLPPAAKALADALRTAHAHILLTRDGPALRPGTRSYARSWIRDGAMIADALLSLGEIDAARDYVEWYAPHQFANGKVPCCVDRRGSDPVPENDSHGELIHAIAQLYRYTGDKTALAKQWPHVAAAIGYMDTLRASETGAPDPAFTGLMPASISHEGYSAKPMHSYWDDFWALTGYKDAVDVAHALGKSDDETRFAAARDAFRSDLYRSIDLAMKAHAIDFIPGCAELGDFDATSTTIALSPGGEQANLPQDKLHATFDRYWRGFIERRDGAKPWDDYTPYEWRVVGTFARLGQRERSAAASNFFFETGERPRAWNQWAEVVGREARQPRFIGDMPHGWVASDFIRSTLDRFAYERGDAIVLAAGVPAAWFDGDGFAVERLRTPYGSLSFRVKRGGDGVTMVTDIERMPPGGIAVDLPREWIGKTVSGDAVVKEGELRLTKPHTVIRIR
ncbi:MAG TPA: coagulation factor 5/8 type domain-containing protein, partial [Rudaea sp.]